MRLITKTVLVLVLLSSVAVAQEQESAVQSQDIIRDARHLKTLYKTDEAIGLLSSIVNPDSVDEDVFAELADCHYQNGNYETASGLYMMLSRYFPEKLLYPVRQTVCFYRMKGFPQAVSAGREVLQRDTITNIATLVGDAFNQMEQYDSALVYYGLSLKKKPLNGSVVSKVAKIYLARKDYDTVITISDSLLALDPDNRTVAPIKGLALYCKGDFDSAIEILEKQDELGNDSYGVHYYLGQSYAQTKVMYRASEELKKAWQIDSSDVNLAISIASVEADSFKPFDTDVKPWLDKALEMLEPDKGTIARVHQQYGYGCYKKQNDWDEAIMHFKAAYENNPGLTTSLSMVAYCYEQKKEYKKALEWYEKFLKHATPQSKGYGFALGRASLLKEELFMQEK